MTYTMVIVRDNREVMLDARKFRSKENAIRTCQDFPLADGEEIFLIRSNEGLYLSNGSFRAYRPAYHRASGGEVIYT